MRRGGQGVRTNDGRGEAVSRRDGLLPHRHEPRRQRVEQQPGSPGEADETAVPVDSVADATLAAPFPGRYLRTPCPIRSNVSGRPSPSTTLSSVKSVPVAWRRYISHGISSTIAPSP